MSSDSAATSAPRIDLQHFRQTCGKYATGVTIVTLFDSTGQPHGLTANSFTSVSLDPPLVLVCVDNKAGILAHFHAAEFMGVNILRESQKDLSNRFAGRGEDRFAGIKWQPGATGVPILPQVIATFECAIVQRIPAGDHTIMLGEVHHITSRHGTPLLYFSSRYHILGTAEEGVDFLI